MSVVRREIEPKDRAARETAESAREGSLADRLAEKTAESERLRFDVELEQTGAVRLRRECDRLRQRIRELEEDGQRLRAELDERNHLLHVVFTSRSWRWTQALRKRLGRH